MADVEECAEIEKAARKAMQANDLVWASGPEWTTTAFGGPPSSPPTIPIIQGQMQSTTSGHKILIDAGDALWFWQDARSVALRWQAFEKIDSKDRALLQAIYDEGGRRVVPGNVHHRAYENLEAAGLIISAKAEDDAIAVEITLAGRRFLHWGDQATDRCSDFVLEAGNQAVADPEQVQLPPVAAQLLTAEERDALQTLRAIAPSARQHVPVPTLFARKPPGRTAESLLKGLDGLVGRGLAEASADRFTFALTEAGVTYRDDVTK